MNGENNECGFCKKIFRKTKTVQYLCPDCFEKASKLSEDNKTKLKMFYDCERLGIIAII